jgi:hypothetical protein
MGLLLAVSLTWGVDIAQVDSLLARYRDAFNSGNFEEVRPLLSGGFTYADFDTPLSYSILESFVYLAPYSIENFGNVVISSAGKDTAIVTFDMMVSYAGVQDTVPQAFVVVLEGDSLKIGALIDPDLFSPGNREKPQR